MQRRARLSRDPPDRRPSAGVRESWAHETRPPGDRVQRPGRLVGEQDLGPGHQAAHQGDPDLRPWIPVQDRAIVGRTRLEGG